MSGQFTSEPRLEFDFAVLSPAGSPEPSLAIAASRAGALGVLNLEFATDHGAALNELARLSQLGQGRCAALIADEELLTVALAERFDALETIVLPDARVERLDELVRRIHGAGLQAHVIATRLDDALAAVDAGADAVIAKGHEAGGWVDEEGSFVLLQRLIAAVPTPVWAYGGIGLYTVNAAYVAGAAGVVLDAQLLLARESPLPDSVRSRIASMDGSETEVLGSRIGAPFRVYSRPGAEGCDALRESEARLETTADALDTWRTAVSERVGWDSSDAVLPIGQDASFANDLAERFQTVGGILGAFKESVVDGWDILQRSNPLATGAPLAESHGTTYPIVQGPMTRVSDRADFAAAVAEAGALPLLALALMRAPEVHELLERTGQLLGDRPWGVGILGFVPPELRAEQLDVLLEYRPPFALIAGGRPDQARALEDEGIATYLHVPSPGLLKLYLADGARRFVFEGRECGGHVGPRTSFVLWDTMVRTLLDELPDGSDDCHVLFAGGIHDATSAAMLAGTASALSDRGVRVGALLGTAYLFTHEATEHGAITERFQEAAIAGRDTALVESGPGHATRCLPSPFVDQFNAEKRRLRDEGVAADELRGRLEQLNIGRLRIASKGADRNPRFGDDPEAPKLVEVDPSDQWERGMYMIGQVAALRDRTTSLADLHRDVSAGSSELIDALPAPEVARQAPPAQADVAIIGVGCILPGAGDASTFWANIMDKVDAIREVPEDRWDWRRYYDADPSARDKIYSRWGGFVDEVRFDPIAFGLPPNSLTSIEPFQLLALLTASAALSDAGYAMRPFDRERTSVVLGAGGGGADLAVGYTVRSALPSLLGDAKPDLGERLNERLPEWTEDSFAGLLMNVAAGRIANRLDFGGANFTVDAACASSLAAIGLGARELQSGTSDMVLAGGVDAIQNPFAYLCFSKTHALSPNGHCRPFDAAADGIAISEGFATVVLKRLADAERDGDRIYAVVRGVGAASDGRDRSLTAPRPEGQMRALRRAYAQARFSPASVELVEAHGTGTVAGDGAEVQALSRLFAEHSEDTQWCAIGSIKSMIGHTKATAGVAGLIKAALALHHRVLPPTIGVSEPNPKANFPESPFYVNTEARPWLSGGDSHPRRAGVSAFGFGGTDFHIVLEEYTGDYLRRDESAVDRWPAELFLWRGTRDDISASLGSLAARLTVDHDYRLADVARTVALEATTPEPGHGTLAVVADSLDDLQAKLSQARELLDGSDARVHTPNGIHWSEQPLAADARVAFLFPGQGSQFVGMGREIALAFPEARECFERADRTLADRYDRPLSRYIFPPPAFKPEDEQRQQAELTDTHVAQAALGATDLAYLHVLEALGIEPEMVGGHSYGEFVALAAANGLGVDDLLRLSEARGRFMGEAAADAPGAMAAVDATPEMLEPLLSEGEVVAANLNAPDQTVLSGLQEHIDAAIEWCRERDIAARALPVACAFHSRYVAPAQQRLAAVLDTTRLDSPGIPVFSNTTGERHAEDPAEIATLLREHLGSRVDFVSEIDAMYRDGARVFIEVGPRSVLTGLVGRVLGEREHLAVPVDRPGRPGLTQLLHCLAAVAAEGVPLRMERLFRGRSAERIELDATDPSARAHPPGTWLVHGGRARPADVPFEPPAPITSHREEELPVTNTSDGGAPPGQALAPVATNGQAGELAPAEPISGEPIAGDRVGDVMGRYHQVMQHFLETQRSVMLAYLGAPRPAVDVRPSPARSTPMPRPPATPVQPPQPAAPPVVEAPAVPDAALAVPDAAPEAVAPPPTGNGHGALSAEEIKDRLLSVVSERTGYPAEMLGLDADLEGDLGIDSIKRVEIAGTLAQTLTLPGGGELDVERLTASRTLREVIAALEEAVAPNAAPAEDLSPEDLSPFEDGPAEEERIGRFVLQAASAPAITATAGLAAAGAVVIVDDETGVGEALADALAVQGEASVRLAPADLPEDAEAATQLAERLREEHGGAKALVHLAALGVCGGSDAGLPTLLLLAQALREHLEHAAAGGGAVVLGASRLGGSFAVDGQVPEGAAPEAAVPGFLKTLAQEWPAMRVKAVDLSAAPREEDASHLLAEMAAADGLVEVGYRDGQRTDLRLVPASLADRAD
ncbi:MAG TPA: beta-ketoacyl synthase N-terminal-like domain-containing protein, partial [Thermoleophilaceae bacterium]